MCGIAGVFLLDGRPPELSELARMNEYLRERGPDGEGYLVAPRCGFAHSRLKIIDLTSAGDQPMRSRDDSCSVTFNGEIYNFRQIRAELEARGARFLSHSDTEVILQGYREWGMPALLERLDGMFAFALHDAREGRAFLCRDRFGKKPLYYLDAGSRLKFASDIRAIWATEPSLSLDYESLDYYLVELSVPQPRTIWREVRQLPPAHYLELDLESGRRRVLRYWRLDCLPELRLSPSEAEEEVERLLTLAVSKRTVSDVPIGAFLSGGTDSGLVVAFLSRQLGSGLRTFTVGFRAAEEDERSAARAVAERYATNHTEILVDPSLRDDLPRLVERLGEPFGDSSAVPSYYVARAIGQNVKVALSGDGGDELFGGYHDYAWAHQTDEYLTSRRWMGPLRRPAAFVSKVLHRLTLSENNYGHHEAYASLPAHFKLFRGMGFKPGAWRIHGPAFEEGARGFAASHLAQTWEAKRTATLAQTLTLSSLETRLLNDYLVKVDRTSMMNSVEVRSPFLDRALAEFAARLPGQLKFGDGTPKYLLRRIAKRHVDPQALERAKAGFGIPVGEWLRGELRGFAEDALLGGTLRKSGLVQMPTLERVLQDHQQRRANHTDRLWCLLVLELWLRHFRP